MSTRSIFEVNHDYAHHIRDDPEGFVRALTSYLNSASTERADALSRFGLRLAWWGHHSDERSVVTKHGSTKL